MADQLTNQIKEMEAKLHKPIEQQLKSLERVSKQSNVMTMDTASKVVDEYRDLERRKCNLIAFNVPESKSIEPSQRKAEDREQAQAFILRHKHKMYRHKPLSLYLQLQYQCGKVPHITKKNGKSLATRD